MFLLPCKKLLTGRYLLNTPLPHPTPSPFSLYLSLKAPASLLVFFFPFPFPAFPWLWLSFPFLQPPQALCLSVYGRRSESQTIQYHHHRFSLLRFLRQQQFLQAQLLPPRYFLSLSLSLSLSLFVFLSILLSLSSHWRRVECHNPIHHF